jgi:hypothetical protein
VQAIDIGWSYVHPAVSKDNHLLAIKHVDTKITRTSRGIRRR